MPSSTTTATTMPAADTRLSSAAVSDDLGKLVLRLALGMMVLMHGLAKIISGPDMVAGLLAKQGLPPALAWLVYLGEVLAPLLVIMGMWLRPAALVIAINMVAAIALVHVPQITQLNNTGGWAIELQGMYLFGALALVLLGAGRISIGGLRGRWN